MSDTVTFAPGPFTDVASILVPGGSWLITSKVVLTNVNPNLTLPSLARCILTKSGSQLDVSEVALAATTGKATLTLHAATQLVAAGEHVKLSCQTDNPGLASATNWRLTAMQVGSITLPGP